MKFAYVDQPYLRKCSAYGHKATPEPATVTLPPESIHVGKRYRPGNHRQIAAKGAPMGYEVEIGQVAEIGIHGDVVADRKG